MNKLLGKILVFVSSIGMIMLWIGLIVWIGYWTTASVRTAVLDIKASISNYLERSKTQRIAKGKTVGHSAVWR